VKHNVISLASLFDKTIKESLKILAKYTIAVQVHVNLVYFFIRANVYCFFYKDLSCA